MGCSSFAQRAMIPAIQECSATKLVCVASRTLEKADMFASQFECDSVNSYEALLERADIKAVYIPLPTGLHEEWCTKAINAGKHILVEKSFTNDYASAKRVLTLARKKNCLIFENFQFQTHSQWKTIKSYMSSGELGDVHLVRSTFGFPPLSKDNFRWNKELGGGALLDAGAYMTKVSQLLLGNGLEVLGASLQLDEETGVEKYGEAMFRNKAGQISQVSFGFDYFYQCRVELLGTKGKLSSNRVFTAPPGFEPVLLVEKVSGPKKFKLPTDNHYLNMWKWFSETITSKNYSIHWENLLDQSRLIQDIQNCASRQFPT